MIHTDFVAFQAEKMKRYALVRQQPTAGPLQSWLRWDTVIPTAKVHPPTATSTEFTRIDE